MPTHVLAFGPIASDEGTLHVLAAVSADEIRASATGATFEEAAAALGRQLGSEAGLTCDAALAAAAKRQGWRVEAVPEHARELRLGLAFALAHGSLLEGIGPMVGLELCHALGVFLHAAPWERFDSDTPLSLTVKGEAAAVREVAVLGAEGAGVGLAVYEKPGTIARLQAARDPVAAARGLDSVAIMLSSDEDRMPWLREAFEGLTGERATPVLIPLRGGSVAPPTQHQLQLLTAALYAAAALGKSSEVSAPGRSLAAEAQLEVTLGQLRVEAPRSGKRGKQSKRSGGGGAGFELKATLLDAEPAIWRTLRAPADLTLGDLHWVLQLAFGWEDCHLHEFEVRKQRYGNPEDDDWGDGGVADEEEVRLGELGLKKGSRLKYLYDFGDSWRVELKVTKALPEVERVECTGGARAGPPEDSGGVWGYAQKLKALEDPEDPEGQEVLEWLGEDWDPKAFDVEALNRELKRVRAS